MDEILAKLLQSELLSEDTKAEISEQWTASVEGFKSQVREEVTMEVRSELAEQWIAERDELVTKVDSFVAEALTREVTELKADIERFRDLEAEYAEKLVEEKHKLSAQVAEDLDTLVDKIDDFFEVRLAAELGELKEDLEVVKQNEFGRKMFEAFASTYATSFVDEQSLQAQLNISESKTADLEKRLAEMEEQRASMLREAKMEKVLAPLSGKKREQMAMVLKNIETPRLEESYAYFIGRIMKEETAAPAAVISEGKAVEKTTLVTGDKPVIIEGQDVKDTAELDNLRRLAGIKQ
jgi:hypothetical protein